MSASEIDAGNAQTREDGARARSRRDHTGGSRRRLREREARRATSSNLIAAAIAPRETPARNDAPNLGLFAPSPQKKGGQQIFQTASHAQASTAEGHLQSKHGEKLFPERPIAARSRSSGTPPVGECAHARLLGTLHCGRRRCLAPCVGATVPARRRAATSARRSRVSTATRSSVPRPVDSPRRSLGCGADSRAPRPREVVLDAPPSAPRRVAVAFAAAPRVSSTPWTPSSPPPSSPPWTPLAVASRPSPLASPDPTSTAASSPSS